MKLLPQNDAAQRKENNIAQQTFVGFYATKRDLLDLFSIAEWRLQNPKIGL